MKVLRLVFMRKHQEPRVPVEGVEEADQSLALELIFRENVQVWLLTELTLVEKSSSLIQLLDKDEKPTQETSEELLRAFLNCGIQDVYDRLLLHPDITSNELERYFTKIEKKARLAPALTFVCVLDEANTSSSLGFLKAVVVDHKLRGRTLPDNIFFVCCINPKREDGPGQSGAPEYLVHALPASMKELRWQFPPLRGDELENFVEEKIRTAPMCSGADIDSVSVGRFAKMICIAQQGWSSIMGESSVSQRDIQRCLTIFAFFWEHPIESLRKAGEVANERLFRCMVLAIATVYYLRIDDNRMYGVRDLRLPGHELRLRIESQMRDQVRLSFRDELDRAVDAVILASELCCSRGGSRS